MRFIKGHNARKLPPDSGLRHCGACDTTKSLDAFGPGNYRCRECRNAEAQAHYRRNAPERKLRARVFGSGAWRQTRHRLRAEGADEETLDFARVLVADPCAYCGAEADTFDHIEPRSKGGSSFWENLTAACRPCNSSKRTASLLGFLLRQPQAVG